MTPRLSINRNVTASHRSPRFSCRAFGCDGCQCCCPHNRVKPAADNPLFRPVADPAAMDREFWRGISRAEFEHLFSGTPLERPGLASVLERIKAIAARD